jgi:hypothetical protein
MPAETTLSPAQQRQITEWLLHGQYYLEVQLTAQEQFGHQLSIATIIELARTALGDIPAVRRTRALDVARLLAKDAAPASLKRPALPIAPGVPVKQIKFAIKRRLDSQALLLAQNRFTLQRTAQLRLEDEYRPKPPPPPRPRPDINRELTPEENKELCDRIAGVLRKIHGHFP